MARKTEIKKYVEAILSDKDLSEDQDQYIFALKKYAEKFIYTTKMQLEKNMIAIDQEIIRLRTLVLNQESPETGDVTSNIRRLEVERQIWELALKLRQERMYRQPNYPMEKNIIDHGVFSISSKAKKKLAKSDLEKVDDTGILTRATGKAIVRHSYNFELTVFDAKVLLAIQKLWEIYGKGKELEVSLYQIAKSLNKTMSGQSYKEIKDSLLALFRTEVQFHYFYSNGQIAKTQYMHILQGVADEGETVQLRFTDYIYESLKSGYFIYLSLAILEDLSSNTAQGLYPFIASQTSQGIFDWSLDEICSLLNIRQPRPSRKVEIIDTACTEMKDFGIIDGYLIYQDPLKKWRLKIEASKTVSVTNESLQKLDHEQMRFQY